MTVQPRDDLHLLTKEAYAVRCQLRILQMGDAFRPKE